MTPSAPPPAPTGQRRHPRAAAGFTLVEVMIGMTLMSLAVTFAYAAILLSNRTAVTNRLFTLAQEMARNQIDRVECAAPFNPQFTPAQIPAELALGTVNQTVPLYVDPTTSATVVTATLTTTVTDLATNNCRSALVTVSYNFRGRAYQVQMNTMRTSDS